jgi:NitT/TauT family transport system substrate-binding protein
LFLFVLALWEYLARAREDLILILPPPSSIIETFFCRFDRIFFHAKATFSEMMGALFIALFTALPLVWCMVRFQSVNTLVQGLFIIFQSLPTFCLAPILIMWFGWGLLAIIIPSSLMMLFPLTMSIYKGLQAARPEFIDYFHLHGATKSQIFIKLQVPFALPSLFAGLRIALTISGIGAIVGEWVGAQKGLGVLMIESRQSLDIEMTFAALLALCIMTVGLYLIGIYFETRCWPMYRTICYFLRGKFGIVSSFLAISIILSACTKVEPKASSGNECRLMFDWMPNPIHVPFFVGKKMKFFEEEHIDLSFSKALALDPLQPLATGQMDLVISYFPRTLAACVKGAELKIIGKLIGEPLDCFVVLEGSGIKTPIDLSGKLVGLADSHFTSFYFNFLVSNVTTIPPRKQNVNFDLVTALAAKQVDAIYGAFWNIEPEQLEAMGLKTRYFSVTEFGVPPYDELVIVSKRNTRFASKDFTERFQKALQKSIDFCLKNPKEAFDIYIAENPDKGPKVLKWEEKAFKRTLQVYARSQKFSEDRVKAFVQWALYKGMITQEPEIGECISSLHATNE